MGLIHHFKEVNGFSKRGEKIKHAKKELFSLNIFTKKYIKVLGQKSFLFCLKGVEHL